MQYKQAIQTVTTILPCKNVIELKINWFEGLKMQAIEMAPFSNLRITKSSNNQLID